MVDTEKAPLTPAISETKDLGIMLYDMDYSNPKDIQAMFYRPQMNNGVVLFHLLIVRRFCDDTESTLRLL